MLRLKWCVCVLAVALCAATSLAADGPTTRPATFRNPLKQGGADPWMQYVDGWYYLSTTTGRNVKLRRARHIGELAHAPDVTVWEDRAPERSHGVWAPEFHRLPGPDGERWYLYVTAFDGKDDANHRLFVAQSTTDSPMGPYQTKAKLLTDPEDKFYAIDGTVLKRDDASMYFVWCGRPSDTGQGLYISKMANPWTLEGSRLALQADGFGCKFVREGPEILRHAGKTMLVYSMCGADTPDYRLGMLVADDGADPLDPASWKQHPKVLFQRNDRAGVYGPGHNFFFKSPDGKEDWIVYHAKTGSRATYADRTTRAQRFTWNGDGTPNFGAPLAIETDIVVPSGE
ncbi:MAG: glycoside hydrolase family 43 protein [Tepidisphaeraceae bacterium]